VSGMGTRLRLVRLDDSHDCSRMPHGQACASDARWVTWSQESAGTRWGPSGTTSGHAHLPGAFPDAATGCLRHHPNGHKRLTRVENTHGYGNALTIVAHQRARAVSDRRTRPPAFAMERCRQASRSRAGEPTVALDTHGMSRQPARSIAGLAASWNAQAGIGPGSHSPGV
jgi:hypothetical protein